MSNISECAPIRSWSRGLVSSWELAKTSAKNAFCVSHDLVRVPSESYFFFQMCEAPEIPTAYAVTYEDVIRSLLFDSPDNGAIANRLRYLCRLCANDPDEYDIDIDSLQALVKFFTEHDLPSSQRISVGPEGLLLAEWLDPTKRCAVAVEFLPIAEMVRFSAFLGDADAAGVKPANDAIELLEPFLSEL